MSETAIDALSRRAAAITRRDSLFTLGGVTLGAVLTAPIGTEAAKNPGKKAKKKARKKCKRQREQCLIFVQTEYCGNNLNRAGAEAGAEGVSQACLEVFQPCCDFFATCQAGQGLSCLHRPVALP